MFKKLVFTFIYCIKVFKHEEIYKMCFVMEHNYHSQLASMQKKNEVDQLSILQ